MATVSVWYNENDPYAAQWLRNLISAGHLPAGDVDERSIVDVKATDLAGYVQCHLFAGVGGWSLALKFAGWPDDRPVWTGSCPCQPFSSAGQQRGHADGRHLWPAFHRLIAERSPPIVFGEQVASRLGREWLSGVRADLESLGYAIGAADLSAASVGAPHIRQRLFWVADANEGQRGRFADGEGCERDRQAPGWQQGDGIAQSGGDSGWLANADGGLAWNGHLQSGGEHRLEPQDGGVGRMADSEVERCGQGDSDAGRSSKGTRPAQERIRLAERGQSGGVADHDGEGRDRRQEQDGASTGGVEASRRDHADGCGAVRGRGAPGVGEGIAAGRLGDADQQGSQGRLKRGDGTGELPAWSTGVGGWSDCVFIPCSDGKARRTEPSIFPLAHAGEWGSGSRVGILRGAGNAIIPALAAAFIRAAMP